MFEFASVSSTRLIHLRSVSSHRYWTDRNRVLQVWLVFFWPRKVWTAMHVLLREDAAPLLRSIRTCASLMSRNPSLCLRFTATFISSLKEKKTLTPIISADASRSKNDSEAYFDAGLLVC